MQAITTRALNPTYTRPMRVKAPAAAGSITINWDYGHDTEQNHRAAAQALADRYGWAYAIVTGQTYNGDFVHVLTQ